MKKTKIKNFLIIVVILSSVLILAKETEACRFEYPPAFFTISIICLDTEPMRVVWAEIVAHELRKIGIGVDAIEIMSYEEIAERTWDYPGPSPIPTHNEGGYDLLFMERNWDLEIEPSKYFHSNATIPNGENIYQYNSKLMDWAIGNLSQSIVLADEIQYAHDVQALLYEDVPSITLLYNYAFYYMKENITGINTLLWNKKAETMANWNHTTKSDMYYGINFEFQEFHPILSKKTSKTNDFQWLNNIFESLIERNMESPYNGAFGPKIATSYYSVDGMTYYFEVDANAKWSDGTKINTTDVKYSFELYENLTKPINWNPLDEWNIFNVSIIDEHNIEIILSSGPIIYSESKMDVPLLPYHIWKDVEYNLQAETAKNWTINYPEKLIGAGPYKLESYNEQDKIIHLVKNPYYKNLTNAQDPILNDLYFVYQSSKTEAIDALTTGQIDMIDSNFQIYPNEINIPDLYSKTTLDYRSEEIAVNMKHPYIGAGNLCPIATPASGRYLRKAISHVIPRNHIIETTLDGYAEPGITPWPVNHIVADEDLVPYEYNPDISLDFKELAGFVYCCATQVSSIFISTIFSSVCFVIITANYLKIKSKKKNFKEK